MKNNSLFTKIMAGILAGLMGISVLAVALIYLFQ